MLRTCRHDEVFSRTQEAPGEETSQEKDAFDLLLQDLPQGTFLEGSWDREEMLEMWEEAKIDYLYREMMFISCRGWIFNFIQ